MRLRFLNQQFVRVSIIALTLMLVVTACGGSPKTDYLLEVTREVTRVMVVTATPDGTPIAQVDAQSDESTPEVTPESTPEPLTENALPTPITNEIIVAEQIFENGRMFYVQPRAEIWVMFDNDNEWQIHEDTWAEGLPESDPSLIVPEGLYQPIRGFGKLWRENETIRNELGWAIGQEQGNITIYTYTYGGEINTDGEYVPGPGYHTIPSYFGGAFIFDETNSTWRRAPETDE